MIVPPEHSEKDKMQDLLQRVSSSLYFFSSLFLVCYYLQLDGRVSRRAESFNLQWKNRKLYVTISNFNKLLE